MHLKVSKHERKMSKYALKKLKFVKMSNHAVKMPKYAHMKMHFYPTFN
jgi:hypothetical protein